MKVKVTKVSNSKKDLNSDHNKSDRLVITQTINKNFSMDIPNELSVTKALENDKKIDDLARIEFNNIVNQINNYELSYYVNSHKNDYINNIKGNSSKTEPNRADSFKNNSVKNNSVKNNSVKNNYTEYDDSEISDSQKKSLFRRLLERILNSLQEFYSRLDSSSRNNNISNNVGFNISNDNYDRYNDYDEYDYDEYDYDEYDYDQSNDYNDYDYNDYDYNQSNDVEYDQRNYNENINDKTETQKKDPLYIDISYTNKYGEPVDRRYCIEQNEKRGDFEYYCIDNMTNKKTECYSQYDFMVNIRNELREKEASKINNISKNKYLDREVKHIKTIQKEIELFKSIPKNAYFSQNEINNFTDITGKKLDISNMDNTTYLTDKFSAKLDSCHFDLSPNNYDNYSDRAEYTEPDDIYYDYVSHLKEPWDGKAIEWNMSYKDENGKDVDQVFGMERDGNDFKYYKTLPDSDKKFYMNRKQFDSQIVNASQKRMLARTQENNKNHDVSRKDTITMTSHKFENAAR